MTLPLMLARLPYKQDEIADDPMTTASRKPRRPSHLSSVTNEADPIGEALRRLHDEVAAEPLPEEFLQLLEDIDKKIAEGEA